MRHLFFAAVFFLAGCGGPSTTPMTIEQVAEANMATVGELNSIFRADTKYHNPDDSYVVFNFQSIKKYPAYRTNDGEEQTNIIVIESVGDKEPNQLFLDSIGYFVLIDEFGNQSFENLGSGTQTGAAFSEILLFSESDVSKYKYLLMGGIDHTKNDGLKAMVFNIE